MPITNSDRENGDGSWVESRKLIISQLRSMDDSIRMLGDRIERMQEKGRERDSLFEAQITTKVAELHTRMAMMEVKAKIWGGAIGLIGGSIGTALAHIVAGGLTK